MSETHPNAFKMEAIEKRQQATVLLAEAEKLDPTPVKDDVDVEAEKPAEETTSKVEPKAQALKSQPRK